MQLFFPYIAQPRDSQYYMAQKFCNGLPVCQALSVLQVVPTTWQPQFCPIGSTPYAVKTGDTLLSLAQNFNTTMGVILALNPRLNFNLLQVSQVICVPSNASITCPLDSFAYAVAPNDTLVIIAERFGVTVKDIIAINPGLNEANLLVEQIICVPFQHPIICPMGSFPYTISRGDTLNSIAILFNTTVADILAINPGLTPYNLELGKEICIPAVATPFR